MDTLQLIDWVSAFTVIYCVWTGFKCKRDWLIYAIACFVYIFINVNKGLYGQATLNIFVVCLATRHAIKAKLKGE